MVTCLWAGCRRAPVPTEPNGTVHAHCPDHEARLLREAFGPQSWHDRARTATLPPLAVGGVLADNRHESIRHDSQQGAGATGAVPPVASYRSGVLLGALTASTGRAG